VQHATHGAVKPGGTRLERLRWSGPRWQETSPRS